MKKPLVSLIALALIVLYCPVNNTANAEQNDQKSSINVTGQASDNFMPDTVFLTLSVETVKKTVLESTSENSQKTEKVINELKKLINENDGDYIKTTSFSVDPVWEYNKDKNKNYLTGYRVTNQITVKTKQIKTAGKIIDSAVNSGANNVQNLNFSIENNKQYCNALLIKASQSALDQAGVVAKALGYSIDGIDTASVSCGTESAYTYYNKSFLTAAVAESSMSSTPVESGTIKINASVNAKFYLNGLQNTASKIK